MPYFWSLCKSASGLQACEALQGRGWVMQDLPGPDTQAVLLDIPGSRNPGLDFDLLPEGCRIFGGNLSGLVPDRLRTVDLLQDPLFLAKNADITARCALRLVCGRLEETVLGLPVLVLGWGRIGKCLARHLKNLGADVTVFARKETDRALLSALGYHSIGRKEMSDILPDYRVIFNTVPAPILSSADTEGLSDCLLIDLASTPGIEHSQVIHARGLPGKMAPISAGKLIAETAERLWKEETT